MSGASTRNKVHANKHSSLLVVVCLLRAREAAAYCLLLCANKDELCVSFCNFSPRTTSESTTFSIVMRVLHKSTSIFCTLSLFIAVALAAKRNTAMDWAGDPYQSETLGNADQSVVKQIISSPSLLLRGILLVFGGAVTFLCISYAARLVVRFCVAIVCYAYFFFRLVARWLLILLDTITGRCVSRFIYGRSKPHTAKHEWINIF